MANPYHQVTPSTLLPSNNINSLISRVQVQRNLRTISRRKTRTAARRVTIIEIDMITRAPLISTRDGGLAKLDICVRCGVQIVQCQPVVRIIRHGGRRPRRIPHGLGRCPEQLVIRGGPSGGTGDVVVRIVRDRIELLLGRDGEHLTSVWREVIIRHVRGSIRQTPSGRGVRIA